jgi:3D (Asp-Asp-Asp) domain-containing protein
MDRSETEAWGKLLRWAGIPCIVFFVINHWSDNKPSIGALTAAASPQTQYFSPLMLDSVFDESLVAKEIASAPEENTLAPENYRYVRSVVAKVTGYTPGEESCGPYADGFTSIGADAWATGGVAADPTCLPYGTMVFIPGAGYRLVDDTGSAMRKAWREENNTHIDLRFQSLKAAKQWGVQQQVIHIFTPEQP